MLVFAAWKRQLCGLIFYEIVTCIVLVFYFIYFAGNLTVVVFGSTLILAG